nr:MAG TPA: Flagellar C1a complex subunit C1a-32 [Caudoviricetes sp.]
MFLICLNSSFFRHFPLFYYSFLCESCKKVVKRY